MKVSLMGVINVTPNSFSDGGKAFDESGLISRITELKIDCDILDFGAESTAPMNEGIGDDVEKERLEFLLSTLKNSGCLKDYQGVLSLDSFRSSNALWFFDSLKSLGFSEDKFLWNDVSGKFDNDVEEYLKSFPGAQYVFCHNDAPERNLSGRHMESVFSGNNEELLPYLIEFFQKAKRDRVLLDPCFGFSKTYDHNLYLLESWGQLIPNFPQQGIVFGISKKSFLRRWWKENMEPEKDLTRDQELQKSEYLHLLWLQNALSEGQKRGLSELIFRVHDPKIGLLAKQRIGSS